MGTTIKGDGNAFGSNNNISIAKTESGDIHVAPAPPKFLHQLPPLPRDFVGRSDELKELMKDIQHGGVTICGLRGMGGVGKSALALVLAYGLTENYPDAGFYLDLLGVSEQPLSTSQAMGRIISAYHPEMTLPDDAGGMAGLYQSVLHGQRAILVLDNAKDAAQVESLLPPPSCMAIVTSRQHIHVNGLKQKLLEALPPEDACKLLVGIAPRIADSAMVLAQRCGYLPLALRLAASFLASRVNISPHQYLVLLSDVLARPEMGLVEASLSLSYEQLGGPSQRLWCALSVFPNTFDDQATAAIWEVTLDVAKEELGELLAYSMIGWNESTGRYRLHDLARLFAARHNVAEREVVCKLHAAYYLGVLLSRQFLFAQNPTSLLEGLRVLDDERANIDSGQLWAASQASRDHEAAQLCMDFPYHGGGIFSLRQHPRERLVWSQAALVAAQRLRARQREGVALNNLGVAYQQLGETRLAIAHHEQALAIARERNDQLSESRALGNLGIARSRLGDGQGALHYHEQQLEIVRKIPDRYDEAHTLNSLGQAHFALGNTPLAIDYYIQSLDIARARHNVQDEAQSLHSLGVAFVSLAMAENTLQNVIGYIEQAIPYLMQCLEITRKIGDQRGEYSILGNIGVAYAESGETLLALSYHEQSLAIARERNDQFGEGDSLFHVSTALYVLGEHARAIELAADSLKILGKTEDPKAEMLRRLLPKWREKLANKPK